MSLELILERIAVALEGLLTASGFQTAAETPPVTTSTPAPSQAPPQTPPARRGRPPKATTESTQAPATPTAPAASAPAAGPPAQSASVSPSQLLVTVTDTVIRLANEFSRDQALAILAKRRGVTRCSELKPDELQGVLDEANAAIAAAQKAAAGASLV